MCTLRASQHGLLKIKQARKEKGWPIYDLRWLEEASKILGLDWEEYSIFADGISEGTWKRFLAGKQPINARAFKAYCQVLGLNWNEIVERIVYQDWGEAPDVSIFFDRTEELNTLKEWIIQDHCRLVGVFGMGGIGKTALAAKVAQQIHSEFDYVIWRSLRNAPVVEEILTEIILFLSNQQKTNLPSDLDHKILRLLHYLRSYRCLLVLDNAEAILQAGDRTGNYRPGYSGYGQLLQCIADTTHNSCLVLTSCEKPKGLATLEGEKLPVCCLQLKGLATATGRKIFSTKGSFIASEKEWQVLISHYAGNPLALKIVAAAIRDCFDSNISKFLKFFNGGILIFDDIRDLLDRQFQRLSELEKEIMYWLAINREPILLEELQDGLITKIPKSEFLQALAALQRRSLIEVDKDAKFPVSIFTLQPVIMEYVAAQLREQICEEINSDKITIFKNHSSVKLLPNNMITDNKISLIPTNN